MSGKRERWTINNRELIEIFQRGDERAWRAERWVKDERSQRDEGGRPSGIKEGGGCGVREEDNK